MESIFHRKKSMKYSVIGNYYVNYQNLMLTKQMYLFLFTNSARRELVSICTQSTRNCNYLSLHYNLAPRKVKETLT